MRAVYGSNPKDLLVCISPSLGPNHAEFVHYKTELPESLWEFKIGENYFDFWSISRRQLENEGILPHHIQIAEIDTYSHEGCFSHRRSTHQNEMICGRQATMCSLISE